LAIAVGGGTGQGQRGIGVTGLRSALKPRPGGGVVGPPAQASMAVRLTHHEGGLGVTTLGAALQPARRLGLMARRGGQSQAQLARGHMSQGRWGACRPGLQRAQRVALAGLRRTHAQGLDGRRISRHFGRTAAHKG
jgi:hypothetical protein